MAGLVVDCSVTMAWHLGEAQPAGVVALLEQVFAHGSIVPNLWHLEVANALREASRQRRIAAEDLDRVLADVGLMPIEVDSLMARQAWTRTWKLAGKHDHPPYDAAYLALALRLDLPLATLDGKLGGAAAKEGVLVLMREPGTSPSVPPGRGGTWLHPDRLPPSFRSKAGDVPDQVRR